MPRTMHSLAALVVVIATNVGDGGCEGGGPGQHLACQVDTRGIRNENGLVVDVITPSCDTPPLEHNFETWLSYRQEPGDNWMQPAVPSRLFKIPGPTGYPQRVQLPCKPGYYRAEWHAWGRGSPLDNAP